MYNISSMRGRIYPKGRRFVTSVIYHRKILIFFITITQELNPESITNFSRDKNLATFHNKSINCPKFYADVNSDDILEASITSLQKIIVKEVPKITKSIIKKH